MFWVKTLEVLQNKRGQVWYPIPNTSWFYRVVCWKHFSAVMRVFQPWWFPPNLGAPKAKNANTPNSMERHQSLSAVFLISTVCGRAWAGVFQISKKYTSTLAKREWLFLHIKQWFEALALNIATKREHGQHLRYQAAPAAPWMNPPLQRIQNFCDQPTADSK